MNVFIQLKRTEHRATNSAVFKHVTPAVQFMYSDAVSTLAALQTKLVTELVAAPDLTFTNHTEFKELSC